MITPNLFTSKKNYNGLMTRGSEGVVHDDDDSIAAITLLELQSSGELSLSIRVPSSHRHSVSPSGVPRQRNDRRRARHQDGVASTDMFRTDQGSVQSERVLRQAQIISANLRIGTLPRMGSQDTRPASERRSVGMTCLMNLLRNHLSPGRTVVIYPHHCREYTMEIRRWINHVLYSLTTCEQFRFTGTDEGCCFFVFEIFAAHGWDERIWSVLYR